MRQRWKKAISRLLAICLALSLLPVPPAKAEVAGIVITDPPQGFTAIIDPDKQTHYGDISVQAEVASGSAISYQWYYETKSGNSTVGGPIPKGIRSSLSLPEDLETWHILWPGEHKFYCELTAPGCEKVTTSPVTVIINKKVYEGKRTDEVKVKSGRSTEGYEYELPEMPKNMYYASGSAIGTLISGAPERIWDGHKAILKFDTKAAVAGISDTITLEYLDAAGYYEPVLFTLKVTAADKIPLTITGFTGENAVYSGFQWKGYQGQPSAAGYKGDFTYSYTGRPGTVYNGGSEAPVNAGDYTLTISPADEDYEGTASVDFSISKKEVTVKCPDYYIPRQGELPKSEEISLYVYYYGFQGIDSEENCLSVKPVPRLSVTDSNTPGTYSIDFLPEAVLNNDRGKNYTLKHEAAKLVIDAYSENTDLQQINLDSAVIDTSQGKITASVENSVSSHTVSAVVSEGATWRLFRDAAFTQEITDKTVSLAEGENTFYLVITAESGYTMRWYEVIITRSSAQTPPAPDPGSGNGTPDKSPVYQTNGSDSSWASVGKQIESSGEARITVKMNGTGVIPASILETVAGKDAEVIFDLGGGVSWRLSGESLKTLTESKQFEGFQALDLKATVGSGNIPDNILKNFAEKLGLKEYKELVPVNLNHQGSFGFTAYLSVYVDRAKAGKTANLFYYNPLTEQMEFQYAGVINEKGSVEFPFTHASDYAIALDNGEMLLAECNKITVSPAKKTLYTGGNTGKEISIRTELPDSLKDLSKEDSLYPVISYTSSNPQVASVTAAGKVKALKSGKAAITTSVTVGGETKTFTTAITIKKAYIKLVKEKNSLKTGESYTYKATGYGVTADSIIWSTAKKAVVVINKKTGRATAKSAGTDYVTAKYGTVQKTIKVIVK